MQTALHRYIVEAVDEQEIWMQETLLLVDSYSQTGAILAKEAARNAAEAFQIVGEAKLAETPEQLQ